MARLRRSRRAGYHHAGAVAAPRPRTQSGGTAVAVSAGALPLPVRPREIRYHRRDLLRSLECSHPRPHPFPHRFPVDQEKDRGLYPMMLVQSNF